jgi:hypothetical protein
MTQIDTGTDIDVVWLDGEAKVRIPLAGDVTQEWCRRYQARAHRENFPARAEKHPARGWVIVDLPDGAGKQEIVAALDAARDMVAATDDAGESPDVRQTESVVREWWAGQRG